MIRPIDVPSHAPSELPTAPIKPVIGVTMGEPGGIGAEVIVKALADPVLRNSARFIIYGMNELMAYAADLAEIEAYWHRLPHDADRAGYALVHDVVVLDHDEISFLGGGSVTNERPKPTREGGRASLAFLDDALAASRRPIDDGGIDAMVTAPIHKTSWSMCGCKFPGHTELLQQRTRSKRSVMLFESPSIRVALATAHLPLMDVRNVLTIGQVFDPIDLGHAHCRQLGIDSPRIALCGLNPHAGESGHLGDEENRVIQPAIENARAQGMDVHGPFPADTLFHESHRVNYDLIVAMYHDQGLIPVKMLAFEEAVNVTLGLPIIRTSPGHGTAMDIVGRNRADARPMKAALRVAIDLAQRTVRQRTADAPG